MRGPKLWNLIEMNHLTGGSGCPKVLGAQAGCRSRWVVMVAQQVSKGKQRRLRCGHLPTPGVICYQLWLLHPRQTKPQGTRKGPKGSPRPSTYVIDEGSQEGGRGRVKGSQGRG